jgi:N-acetylglucosaminyldiphosphoundecaprenol N-acetyl-beta-D-mannosaminyltransferase
MMQVRSHVLGCPVDRISAVALRRQLPEIARGARLTHLVTLNPEQVMQARADPDLRAIIERAELVTADGAGITAALRLQGERSPERITGVEIVEWLAKLGLPLFLLGGVEGVAERAAHRLRERHPATEVLGHWSSGTPEPHDDAESIRRIGQSAARVVCVAYGAPRQLHWIERNRHALQKAGVGLAVGVGGALDYHAGAVQRPPRLVRRIGLEWLARLIREPWRWRRQTVLPVFAVLAAREAVAIRLSGR